MLSATLLCVAGCNDERVAHASATAPSTKDYRPTVVIVNDEALSLVNPSRETLDSSVPWIVFGNWIDDKTEQLLKLTFDHRYAVSFSDGTCNLRFTGEGVGVSASKFDVRFDSKSQQIRFFVHGAVDDGSPPMRIDAYGEIVAPGRTDFVLNGLRFWRAY